MLFRTKFLLAFIALTAVALGTSAFLIAASQRTETNQLRSDLAHESLTGYFQLSTAVFRTFKLTRRDLISGPGRFGFDFEAGKKEIGDVLDQIEANLIAEAALDDGASVRSTLADLAILRSEIMQALSEIAISAEMIRNGQPEAGRQKAADVLQGKVDVAIVGLIEEGTDLQRDELFKAQREIRQVQQATEVTAWAMAALAVLVSIVICYPLVRRFQNGLQALDSGARAYAAGNLDHAITLPGRDELSKVAEEFTAMARQMKAKQKEVETARRVLEDRVAERTSALSVANAELRRNDNRRRQFFADIGHELRTPVSAIRGEAEVALRARSGRAEAQEAALTTIVTIADELTASVNDLFMIARDMAGVLDFRIETINLGHVVSLGIEQIQSLSSEHEATIAVHLPKDTIRIRGDTSRITQLIRILIANALQHVGRAVRVDVTIRSLDGMAVLTVADDGPGIPEQDWPRIFDRFVKGSKGGRGDSSGTGLGLAIARSIVRAHAGTIEVRHSPSGGAELLVRFPRLHGEAGS